MAINLRKTTIEELPVDLDRRWTSELRQYAFRDEEVSAEELIDYFGRAFALKAQNPHDPVLAYAVARLRTLEIEEWELLENLISQCALAERGAMEALVTHYFLNSDDAHGPALDRVIASILEEDSVLALGTEVSWALWTAIWFKRPIAFKLAKRLDGNPDPVVAILALYAKSLGLIKKSVGFPIWASWMRADSLFGPQWLLAYEADIQGWLPSAEKPNHVDSVPEFSLLKEASISFFNGKIDKPTRSLLHAVEDEEPTVFS